MGRGTKSSNIIKELKGRVKGGLSKVLKGAEKVEKFKNKIDRAITKETGFSSNSKSLRNQVNNEEKVILNKTLARNVQKFSGKGHGSQSVMGLKGNGMQQPILLKKREFVRMISGSSALNLYHEPISVLNPNLFPWGSQILPNYEMYRIKRCDFHFTTTSADYATNSSLGIVAMCITYDPDDPLINDLPSLLNYSGAKNKKISLNDTVRVVTANNPLPVRFVEHNSNVDIFNDYGVFYIGTQGNPTTGVIGELWVDYEIEVYIPRINNMPSLQHISSSGAVSTGSWTFAQQISITNSSYGLSSCAVDAPNGRIGFIVPGYYLIHFRFWNNTASASGVTSNTTVSSNASILPIPTAWGQTQNPTNYNTLNPAQTINVGGNSSVSQWYYVDAMTNFLPALNSVWPTWISFNQQFTTSALSQINADVMIFRIPFLSNQPNPLLADFNNLNDQIKKQGDIITKISKRLGELTDWDDCDNNNNESSQNTASELVRSDEQIPDTSNLRSKSISEQASLSASLTRIGNLDRLSSRSNSNKK